MRFDELVAMFYRNINERETRDSHAYTLEGQDLNCIFYIESLLLRYKGDHTIIDNEELLEPFYQLLSNHWMETAFSDLSYLKNPNTKSNVYCQTLTNCLIVAANQFNYKKRNVEEKLMPSIDYSLPSIAKNFLNRIEDALKNFKQENIFLYIEGCYALYELKKVLNKFIDENKDLDANSLSSLAELYKKRWHIIEDTNADYINNPKSEVNRIYSSLAQIIRNQCNTLKLCDIEQVGFMMPDIDINLEMMGEQKIKNFIYQKMQQNDVQLQEIIRKTTLLERQFAEILMDDLYITNSNKNILPLVVLLENYRSMKELQNILTPLKESNEAVSSTTIKPLVLWLSNRWNFIHDTPASYKGTLKNDLNTSATTLAYLIFIFQDKLALNIDHHEKLLMPYTENNQRNLNFGNKRLEESLVKKINNLNDLIENMCFLPKKHWKNYLQLFDAKNLLTIVTGGTNNLLNTFKIKDLYLRPLEEKKALLLIFLEIYTRKRMGGKKYNNLFSPLLSFVIDIPDQQRKLNAILHVVDNYLLGQKTLIDFTNDLNDMQSNLQPFVATLTNGNLKHYIDQFKIAAVNFTQDNKDNKMNYCL